MLFTSCPKKLVFAKGSFPKKFLFRNKSIDYVIVVNSNKKIVISNLNGKLENLFYKQTNNKKKKLQIITFF